jgi:hypothetical protein
LGDLLDRLIVNRSEEAVPSRVVQKLAGAAAEIALQDTPQLEFLHSTFAHVGLPRQPVQHDGPYRRECGNCSILINPGSLWNGDDWEKHPIPFGTKPRLIMAYVCTYATRHQTQNVPVGASMTEFMKILGHKSVTGGKNGNITMFKRQVLALSAADIRIGYKTVNGVATAKNATIDGFMFWNDSKHPHRDPWPGLLHLSNGFYESLREHALPIDATALRALDSSALAMDLYVWLAHRLCRVAAKPVLIHWPALAAQFAEGNQELRDFKKYFKSMLKRVLAVYPDARVELPGGGLLIKQSPPPIPQKVRIFTPKAA